MALIIGTDTYITEADAETYIAGHYLSTDAKRTAWTALTATGDKENALRKAAAIIDRQPYAGARANPAQAMEFPRALYTTATPGQFYPVFAMYGENTSVQQETPEAVKAAQVEIALTLATGEPQRMQLQRQGVKSFSLGKLSESYSGKSNPLISNEAREFLAPFLLGGAGIC